jgi:hypothetical protein
VAFRRTRPASALAAILLAAAGARGLRGDVIVTAVADEELASIGTEAVLERVRADAHERVELAKRVLAESELPAAQRELLCLVADGVVDRYS